MNRPHHISGASIPLQEYCKSNGFTMESAFECSLMSVNNSTKQAITTVYVFFREISDILDKVREKHIAEVKLHFWSQEIDRVFMGSPMHPVGFALQEVIQQYSLKKEIFKEILHARYMDLECFRYNTFEDLLAYCKTLGASTYLLFMEILGYQDPETRKAQELLGIAIQLITIISNIGKDLRQGRIYIPKEDLENFSVNETDILEGRYSEQYVNLMQFQAKRAKDYYQQALETLPIRDYQKQKFLLVLGSLYLELLNEIVLSNFQVMHQKIKLPPLREHWISFCTKTLIRKKIFKKALKNKFFNKFFNNHFKKISRKSIAKSFAVALLFGFTLFSFVTTAQATSIRFASNIPDVGQEGQLAITNETERAIGKTLLHKIYSTDLVTTDAVVQEYLHGLGKRLAKGCPRCDFQMFYFPVSIPALNAFAFFGGNVAVHTGLIYALENESELAGVLAHETAHVTQRHLARMLTNQKKMKPITIAEILLSIGAAALGAPELGIGIATAAMGGQVQQMINYTREHEHEADRIGIQILYNAGFDPLGLPGVFKKLSEQQRYQETPPEYFLTHPLFENRIADAYNRAEKLPPQNPKDNLLFHLVRARIEVSSTEKTHLLLEKTRARLRTDKTAHKTFAEYAHALSLAKARKFTEARQSVQDLMEQHLYDENVWVFQLSLAEIEQSAGNLEEAQTQLANLAEGYPGHPAILLAYAEVLMENKQYDKAKQALLRLNPKRAEDPYIYHALVKANGKLGRTVDAHRAQAEWYFLRGEYKKAEQQLDWAMEKAGSNQRLVEEIRFRKDAVAAWIKRQKELKL